MLSCHFRQQSQRQQMIDKKEKNQTSRTHKQVTAAVRCRRYCSHEGRHTPRTTPRTTLLIRLLLLCCSSYCGSSTASTYSGNGDLFPAVYTAPKSSTLDDKVVHCSCRRVTYSCVAAPSECYVNGYCDRSVEWKWWDTWSMVNEQIWAGWHLQPHHTVPILLPCHPQTPFSRTHRKWLFKLHIFMVVVLVTQ